MKQTFEATIGGRKVVIETGHVAMQANAACIIRVGDTAVLTAATMASSARPGLDFFPLTVDFEAKMYSVGKIPGGFIKRESRPPEASILTSRLTDRPIRPLFDKRIRREVQVITTVISVDPEITPDVWGMVGSSVALSISDIPFAGPTGSVVVGLVDGEFVINPTVTQMEQSDLELTVAGTRDAVMMVEAGAKEVSEEKMLEAILFGHEEIKKIVDFIDSIVEAVGKEKQVIEFDEPSEQVENDVKELGYDILTEGLKPFDRYERKATQEEAESKLKEILKEKYGEEEFEEKSKEINDAIYNLTKKIVRGKILKDGVRPDGRKLDEVRPIWCETSVFDRTHGSAIFTRGETQALTITTLGPISEKQRIDGITNVEEKRYMHHYNMPPYSVGEARPLRSPGRREIGHGALGERALLPVIPPEEEFPYTLRLVSEILSSNGSTSQASICGSTLSLMDAGVPIKAPVAGVAMGLMKDEEEGNIAVLTDIQGLEDFLGDMDFKVAGTKDGITAIQMDMKIKGIDKEVLERALAQAKEGRMHILGKMLETLDTPRAHLSEYAPKMIMFNIKVDKIREVIGPGGKMINKIIDETGVKIDIEDDGRVIISTTDEAAGAKAREMIESIVKEVEVGEIYFGKVVRIMNFGAFVELIPGKDGMVHISRLAEHHVKKVEDEVKIGDRILVKVIEIDSQNRVNLSRKGLIEEEKKMKEEMKK
jgi:polyribonucleotide nucleotidyltransferase